MNRENQLSEEREDDAASKPRLSFRARLSGSRVRSPVRNPPTTASATFTLRPESPPAGPPGAAHSGAQRQQHRGPAPPPPWSCPSDCLPKPLLAQGPLGSSFLLLPQGPGTAQAVACVPEPPRSRPGRPSSLHPLPGDTLPGGQIPTLGTHFQLFRNENRTFHLPVMQLVYNRLTHRNALPELRFMGLF